MTYEEAFNKAKTVIEGNTCMHNWSIQTLAIWLRDGCKCVYCDECLLSSAGIMDHYSSLDHLLPRKKYQGLLAEPWNLVLCCRRCNNIKRRYDAAEVLNITDPSIDDMPIILENAKNQVQSRIKGPNERYDLQRQLINELID